MSEDGRIELAHAADFTLGSLSVRPPTREVESDGTVELLEPRVMQVLVALARADGAILSRDDLIRQCWEGRIVGEDAINRVLSRLRRTAEGIGQGCFRIETITKVGYRLVRAGSSIGTNDGAATPQPPSLARRRVVMGGLAVGAVAAAAGGWWLLRGRDARSDPAIAALMDQAALALRQDTPEGQNQALGLYRKAIELAPEDADAWGGLAAAYAFSSRWRTTEETKTFRLRSREAADRADAIEPGNVFAAVARIMAAPNRGHWLETERGLRALLARHQNDGLVMFTLGNVLCSVGRCNEAADLYTSLRRSGTVNPGLLYREIVARSASNQLEETDRLIRDARELYPTHYTLWFAHVYFLMYSDRAASAIGIVADVASRPTGIPQRNFDDVHMVARALADRNPAEIDKVVRIWLERAREGAGFAENAALFCAAFGRLDDAFAVLDAYFFGRGFRVPEVRFTAQQGSYTPFSERQTAFLFNRAFVELRKDPRFDRLAGELGLKDYWRLSGSKPDYLSA